MAVGLGDRAGRRIPRPGPVIHRAPRETFTTGIAVHAPLAERWLTSFFPTTTRYGTRTTND